MFRGDQAILLLIVLYAPGVLIYLVVQYFRLEPIVPVASTQASQLIEAIAKTEESNMHTEAENALKLKAGCKVESPNANSESRGCLPCQMDSCFNYNICPIFTNLEFKLVALSSMSPNDLLYKTIVRSSALVKAYSFPCITLMVWKQCESDLAQLRRENGLVQKYADSNLVIWLDCPESKAFNATAINSASLFPRAMVISSHATATGFQHGYDIVCSFLGSRKNEIFATAKLKRGVLINFDDSVKLDRSTEWELTKDLTDNHKTIKYLFPCRRPPSSKYKDTCGRPDKETLENAVFTVIRLPKNINVLSTPNIQHKLYNILKHGSIPVVVGLRFLPPFHELIDWSKILIRVPAERVLQLPKMLTSYPESVMETMRINGRLAFNEHLGSTDKIFNTILTMISTRLGIPGIHYLPGNPEITRAEYEAQKPKIANTTHLVISTFRSDHSNWYLPQTKWTNFPNLWSQSFDNIATEMRSNIALPDSLHLEKFTIVIPTFNRVPQLMKLLVHLKGLPRLDKIIIAWNSRDPPSRNLSWPLNMHVPIHVILMPKNSLNNRFMPFDAIETDAVLSLDDDIYVSHANLLFGFRVWQENRQRLVGYPGRGVYGQREGRDWFYDTKQCSVSLVLTGCAFIHKMYHVLYSFHMPAYIRKKVDMKMNCEDIAMNFMISHLTQQPPIKVTPQDKFSCYGCGPANNSLSSNGAHLGERTSCIREFGTVVYGYYPLFNTQFLAADMFLKKNNCLAVHDENTSDDKPHHGETNSTTTKGRHKNVDTKKTTQKGRHKKRKTKTKKGHKKAKH